MEEVINENKDLLSELREEIKNDHVKIEEEDVKDSIVEETKTEQKAEDESLDSLKEKLSKFEKITSDNQKYSRSVNQKLKETITLIDKLVEDMQIDEDTAAAIYLKLKTDSIIEPKDLLSDKVSQKEEQEKHPINKYMDIVDRELFATYEDVSEDKDAHKKLKAFEMYLQEASDEEVIELDKTLGAMKSPMSILKKFISIGDSFLKDGFDDFQLSGGLRKFVKKQKEEKENLQKEIDKLKKKLIESSEFKPNTKHWLGSGGNSAQAKEFKSLTEEARYESMVAAQRRMSK